MIVIKRDNTKEEFNPDKIHEKVTFACEGVNNVSISEIEMNANSFLGQKEVKSSDIQKALIMSAAEMISEQTPNYEIVASRLLNQQLRKEVYNQYQPKPFLDQIKKNVNLKLYDKSILEKFTEQQIEYFGSKINYDKDNQLTYVALQQLYKKYLVQHKGLCVETPQEMYMLMSMFIFDNEKDIIDFYKLLANKQISLSTPICNGLRTPFKRFISCSVIDLGDTTNSISDGVASIMKMTASKAGIGVNAGKIRGLGANVGNGRVKHTGLLPILKTIEKATKSFTQLSRGGCHLAGTNVKVLKSFEIDNKKYIANENNLKKFKDIEKFNYKNIKIQDIKENDFVLSYNIETQKQEIKKVLKTYRPIVKQNEQMKITLSDNGYIINSKKHPLLILRDNKWVYIESKDCKINDILQTDKDLVKITKIETNLNYDENSFYDIEVQDNNNFYAGFGNTYCNHNSSNITYPFYHIEIESVFPLGNAKGTETTRVRHCDHTIIFNKFFLERALQNKKIKLFYMNDVKDLWNLMGNYEKFKELYEKYEKTKPGKVVNAFDILSQFISERFLQGRLYCTFADNVDRGPFKQNDYITNLCCLKGDTKVQTKDGLKDIKDIKENDFVLSYNTKTKEKEFKKVLASQMTHPKRKVIKITYNGKSIICTPDHRFLTQRGYIEAKDLLKTDELILNTFNTFNTFNTLNELKIEYLETEIPVYDIQVQDNNNFFANDICVHNCEILLKQKPLDGSEGNPEIASCILAGINHGYINDNKIPRACELIVKFLDNLIDYMTYGSEYIEYSTINRRALGIGHSDLFHFLAKNKVFYNTKEGRELIHDRIEMTAFYITKASIELAKERGACNLVQDTKYSEGWLPIDSCVESTKEFELKQDWESLRQDLKEFGIRNSTLMANAPFGNCISKDQRIQTQEGNLNLYDILKRENLNLNLSNLKEGWIDLKNPLHLSTKDGDSISERFYINGNSEVYEIELENGDIIKCTGNHGFFSNNKFVLAKDLKINDTLELKDNSKIK